MNKIKRFFLKKAAKTARPVVVMIVRQFINELANRRLITHTQHTQLLSYVTDLVDGIYENNLSDFIDHSK